MENRHPKVDELLFIFEGFIHFIEECDRLEGRNQESNPGHCDQDWALMVLLSPVNHWGAPCGQTSTHKAADGQEYVQQRPELKGLMTRAPKQNTC